MTQNFLSSRDFPNQSPSNSPFDFDAEFKKIIDEIHDSTSIFSIIEANDERLREFIIRKSLVLDSGTISKYYQDTSAHPLGTLRPNSGVKLSQKCARKFSDRLAQRASSNLPGALDAFSNALFFPVWSELCVLIPARHVARHIARTSRGRLVLIPLEARNTQCLKYWDKNELESFFIAFELHRYGVAVAFLSAPGKRRTRSDKDKISLTFSLSDYWRNKRKRQTITKYKSSVFYVPSGIRRPIAVRDLLPSPVIFGSSFGFNETMSDRFLWDRSSARSKIRFDFNRSIESEFFTMWSTASHEINLFDALLRLIAPLAETAYRNALSVTQRFNAKEVHICDHLFFESSLIAQAVIQKGGLVSLWPHSSNAVHHFAHDPIVIRKITAVTQISAKQWAHYFPLEKIDVDSSLMLENSKNPRPYINNEPVSIILFAGAHILNRMPLINCIEHSRTWSTLLDISLFLPNNFQIIVKPKNPWESKTWILSHCEDATRLQFTDTHANDLEFPNMIFLCVSIFSSALLEGMGRGIPCMFVSGTDTLDNPGLDPSIIPTGPPSDIIGQILKLADPLKWRRLTQKQMNWFDSQTRWPYC